MKALKNAINPKDVNLEHIYEDKKDKETLMKVRLTYYDDCGKRRELSKTFSTKKYGTVKATREEAENWRDEAKRKIKNEVIIQSNINYTLNDVFELTIKNMNQSFETKRKWRKWFNKYILAYVPKETLFKNITWDKHIQPSLNAMVNVSSQDLIDRVKSMWRKMCIYAYAKKITTSNEMLMSEVSGPIKSKAVTSKRNNKIDMQEFNNLLNEFASHKRDKKIAFLETTALVLMAYLGMRPAEVFVLSKKDFNLEDRTIHLYRRLGSTTTEKYVETSLGNKGYERYIPYPSDLDEMIKTLIENYDKDKLFSVNGVYLNSDYLSNDVKRISKGKIRPYMLRHAFINDLIINKNKGGKGTKNDKKNAENDILSSETQQQATQELTGHVDRDTTYGYVTDMSKDEIKRLVKKGEEEAFESRKDAISNRAEDLKEEGLCGCICGLVEDFKKKK